MLRENLEDDSDVNDPVHDDDYGRSGASAGGIDGGDIGGIDGDSIGIDGDGGVNGDGMDIGRSGHQPSQPSQQPSQPSRSSLSSSSRGKKGSKRSVVGFSSQSVGGVMHNTPSQHPLNDHSTPSLIYPLNALCQYALSIHSETLSLSFKRITNDT